MYVLLLSSSCININRDSSIDDDDDDDDFRTSILRVRLYLSSLYVYVLCIYVGI